MQNEAEDSGFLSLSFILELQEIGAPDYLAGDYQVRVVPNDDVLALPEGDPRGNFFYQTVGAQYNEAKVMYPVVIQPFSPNRFGNSSNAGVSINNSFPIDEDLNDRPILWGFIEKAETEYPDITTELANVNTSGTQYALVDELFQQDFGTASINNLCGSTPGSTCPGVSEEQEALDFINEIQALQNSVDTDLGQLLQYKQSSQLQTEAAKALRSALSAKLRQLIMQSRKGLTSYYWFKPSLKMMLLKLRFSSILKGLGLGLMQELLTSGNDLIPSHKALMESYVFLYQELERQISSKIGDTKEDIDCDYLKQNANIFEADTAMHLQKQHFYLQQDLAEIVLGHLSVLKNPPYNVTDLVDLSEKTRSGFLKTYKLANVMNELCSECLRDDVSNPPRQALLNALSDVENNTNLDILDLTSKGRVVNEEDLQCRICKMNDSERDDFDITLKIRTALRSDDAVIKGDKLKVGFKPENMDNKTIGFSWLPLQQKLLVAFSGKDALSPDAKTVGPLNQPVLWKEYVKVIRSRIATRLSKVKGTPIQDSPDGVVILGMEAASHGKNPVYQSLKTTGGEDNQNDAELKILETTLHTPALQEWDALNLDIFTDRASCAYCQEVSFRANHVFDDYQILGKIRPQDTNIAGVTMRGKPLFSGERIPIKKTDNMVERTIDFIEQVNRDKAQACEAW